ncbi:Ig-like V-type domain-containing protein FAM187A isoform X2 [Ornithodoros turicata]|uniref:Ig-like V-type domain-containing protein FAM187A isoform X2 n=1 Tax=Ornithodoros turicata TaxID=34597 RepID=UPI003138CC72
MRWMIGIHFTHKPKGPFLCAAIHRGRRRQKKKRFLSMCNQVFLTLLLCVIQFLSLSYAYDFWGTVKALFKAGEIEWSWDQYEKCIQERVDTGTPLKKALLVPFGSKVEMSCPGICFPPEAESQSPWHRVSPVLGSAIGTMPMGKGDQRRQLMGYGALVITDALPGDTGIYRCLWAGRTYSLYHLQVVRSEPYEMVWEDEYNETDETLTLEGYGMRSWLDWSEWSDCDRCGSVGRRRRKRMHRETKALSRTMLQTSLAAFPDGVPCRSSLVPLYIAENLLKNRTSVHMIGLCREPCVKDTGVVVVTDASGLVEEVVDNSKGIFSLKQKLLELPKRIFRKTVKREQGAEVILSCSRQRFSTKFFQWRNGSILLNPMLVFHLSNRRVKIDLGNNLHILRAETYDSAIYSCYDGTRMVATIRLYITKPSIFAKLRRIASYFNVVVMVVAILLVIISICRGSQPGLS